MRLLFSLEKLNLQVVVTKSGDIYFLFYMQYSYFAVISFIQCSYIN
jgi:hypothetical protein